MEHLKYVLAKVEVAQMPKLQDYRDTILESIRHKYPIAQPIKFEEIAELNQANGKLDVVERNPILSFQDIENTWGFRIHPKAIFLHTTKYIDFDDFLERLASLLEVVNSAISITHFNFCGMRYVNKFKADSNGNFTYAIKESSFIQPNLNSKFLKAGSNHQAYYVAEPNVLKINGGISIGGQILPQDLRDIASDLVNVDEKLEGPWAHLDIDSFHREQKLQSFNIATISEIFTSLRANADESFKLCTNFK